MSELRAETGLPADAAAGLRFAVVVSRFNEAVTSALRDGALETLWELGADRGDVRVLEVPGAYEVPMGAALAARDGQVDAVVCIGALIRGETPHFDVLAHSVAVAVQDAARQSGVPMAFGVLTCEDAAQARARSGGDRGNKGREAALAAIEMARLFRRRRTS